MTTFRIRHCDGNKAAWLFCRVRDDGTESDSFGSYTVALTLPALLRNVETLNRQIMPQPGDTVEFQVEQQSPWGAVVEIAALTERVALLEASVRGMTAMRAA